MMTLLMGTNNHEITRTAEHVYKHVQTAFSAGEESSLILAHSGKFSQELVNSICEGIENMMISAQVKKGLVKRMFSILIEGLQNLRIHGRNDETGDKYGHVIVAKNKYEYLVSFGSYASKGDVLFLTKHIEKLNSYSQEEVKEFYLEKLSNGFMSDKGGAGLGFITIAMKSKNKMVYDFHTSEDKELFYFEITSKLNIEEA